MGRRSLSDRYNVDSMGVEPSPYGPWLLNNVSKSKDTHFKMRKYAIHLIVFKICVLSVSTLVLKFVA